MQELRTLLVATDLSPHADQALTRTALLASQHAATLIVLHVIDHVLGTDRPPDNLLRLMFGAGGEVEQQLRQRATQALQARLAAMELPVAHNAHIEAHLGTPFLEIIRQARAQHADLIVLGAHGGHYLKRWLLGTTTERVVRKGDRPVLVVKRPARARYRHVLHPTDFSDNARRALTAAQRLAPEARFTLLHVYDFTYDPALRTGDVTSELMLRLQQEYEQDAHARLAKLVSSSGIDPDKTSIQVRYGYPGFVVAGAAQQLRTDLVAIGTRGQSGIEHLLLGSVAEHVLREAHCDVLVVPPRSMPFTLP